MHGEPKTVFLTCIGRQCGIMEPHLRCSSDRTTCGAIAEGTPGELSCEVHATRGLRRETSSKLLDPLVRRGCCCCCCCCSLCFCVTVLKRMCCVRRACRCVWKA